MGEVTPEMVSAGFRSCIDAGGNGELRIADWQLKKAYVDMKALDPDRTPSSATPEVSEAASVRDHTRLVERLTWLAENDINFRNIGAISEAATALETLEARVKVLTALIEKQLRQKASAAWDIEARALLKQLDR